MNKRDLSNAISEGIYEGLNRIVWDLIKGMFYAIGLFILLGGIWWGYHALRYDGNEIIATGSQPDECNYPYLYCTIYQEGRYFKCQDGLIHEKVFYIDTNENSNISGISITSNNSIMPCADVSYQIPYGINSLCGYQEANAWFKQFKQNYNYSYFKLKMECN